MADHGDAGHPRRVSGCHDWDGHSVQVSADLQPEVRQLDDGVHGEDGEEKAKIFVFPKICLKYFNNSKNFLLNVGYVLMYFIIKLY